MISRISMGLGVWAIGKGGSLLQPLPKTVQGWTISLLGTYLTRLASEGTTLPNTQTFNTEVLGFIDRYQNVISADDLVRVARILKLKN